MPLSSLEVFSAMGQIGLTLASSSVVSAILCILHNSCSYRNTSTLGLYLKEQIDEMNTDNITFICSLLVVRDVQTFRGETILPRGETNFGNPLSFVAALVNKLVPW